MRKVRVKREVRTPKVAAVRVGWGLPDGKGGQFLVGLKAFDDIDLAEGVSHIDRRRVYSETSKESETTGSHAFGVRNRYSHFVRPLTNLA
jgi:hypothetical protein